MSGDLVEKVARALEEHVRRVYFNTDVITDLPPDWEPWAGSAKAAIRAVLGAIAEPSEFKATDVVLIPAFLSHIKARKTKTPRSLSRKPMANHGPYGFEGTIYAPRSPRCARRSSHEPPRPDRALSGSSRAVGVHQHRLSSRYSERPRPSGALILGLSARLVRGG